MNFCFRSNAQVGRDNLTNCQEQLQITIYSYRIRIMLSANSRNSTNLKSYQFLAIRGRMGPSVLPSKHIKIIYISKFLKFISKNIIPKYSMMKHIAQWQLTS